ncbi:fatty acyl-CoA hydrolase [Malassezia pachydermatis]|uniref:Thioesterase domain-containing protein n=1 Tax=Malassezia pachydermatis TaxID=77020 RepID=A0A0M8MXZ8_9BASI|nr:hypothetical protein Malapachy_2235 [Malassezia pachydermatis]KOS15821.1 hypothetical protein Malapachy_2235 [Malassezia pachydermatis]
MQLTRVVQTTPCVRFVRNVHKSMMDVKGHDSHNTNRLRIVAARPGFVDTRFDIGEENLNRARTLHGGLIATLVDSVGSLAVASRGWFNTGISTDINATFVKPGGKLGDTVRVTGEIIGMGKTLAYTRIELRDVQSQALLAYGSHTKYIRMGLNAPENVEFDENGERIVRGPSTPST